jgi:hypothetical protein
MNRKYPFWDKRAQSSHLYGLTLMRCGRAIEAIDQLSGVTYQRRASPHRRVERRTIVRAKKPVKSLVTRPRIKHSFVICLSQ